MSVSLSDLLGSPESVKRYRKAFNVLLREDRFSDAEAVLLADLGQLPFDLCRICQSLSMDEISVMGWDQLNALLSRPRLGNGKVCTALQIDMSNHVNSSDGGPSIEVSFYSDDAFLFSNATKEQILAKNEQYCPPWTGNFEEIENPLEMTGLGRLNSTLERQQWRERPKTAEEKVSFALAELFRTLRFQQAIKREIDTRGLVRAVPVLVGSNETGPFLETVHFPRLTP